MFKESFSWNPLAVRSKSSSSSLSWLSRATYFPLSRKRMRQVAFRKLMRDFTFVRWSTLSIISITQRAWCIEISNLRIYSWVTTTSSKLPISDFQLVLGATKVQAFIIPAWERASIRLLKFWSREATEVTESIFFLWASSSLRWLLERCLTWRKPQ